MVYSCCVHGCYNRQGKTFYRFPKLYLLNNLQSSSIFYEAKRSILYYIAGYIVRKMNLNCVSCKESLLLQRCDDDYISSLVNFKNRGGLISCSDSVFKIVSECEMLFYLYTENLKKIFVQNFNLTIINQVLESLV